MLKEIEIDITNYKPNMDGLEHVNQVNLIAFTAIICLLETHSFAQTTVVSFLSISLLCFPVSLLSFSLLFKNDPFSSFHDCLLLGIAFFHFVCTSGNDKCQQN